MKKEILKAHGVKKKNILYQTFICSHKEFKQISKSDFVHGIASKAVVCAQCGSVRGGYSYEMDGVKNEE